MKSTLFTVVSILEVSMVLCSGFTVDMLDVRMNKMSNNIDDMKVAIMGLAEYVQEINRNLKVVKLEVSELDVGVRSPHPEKISPRPTVDDILKRKELVQKIEKLFRNENITKVDIVKNELTSIVEGNFIKMLAAILLTGPVQAQERTSDILKLMRNTLNGKLDFKSVVDRLPFLIRNSETNQFILLLNALRDNERLSKGRQLGGLEDLGKVIDAAGKLDMKQVSEFLKEIPKLFESIESVVDGVDEYF